MNQILYFGLFILVTLYLCYRFKFLKFVPYTEHFTEINNTQLESPLKKEEQNAEEIKQIIDSKLNDPCRRAKFYSEKDQNGVTAFCGDSDFATGCTQVSKEREQLLDAFSVFGTYITELDPEHVDKCLQSHSQTLSDWGLCNDDERNRIQQKLNQSENKPIFDAIATACSFYKEGNGGNVAVLQTSTPIQK